MTATSQDFTVYAGDAASVVFTVKDDAGAAIDISSSSQIDWNARRDLESAIVIEKTKTGGGISFVTDGTDGKFKLFLTKTDTAALSGFYLHEAIVTDAGGNPTTVTTGRMQAARMPASTYSGDPSVSDKDAVRYWINDTDASSFALTDPEINYALTQYGNPLLAAAACARSLAAKYAKLVDKTLGPLRLSYSQRSKAYLDLAATLQSQGEQSGVSIYAGGTSLSDMAAVDANSDRNPQPFSRKQFDIPNAANPVTTDPDNQFNPVV